MGSIVCVAAVCQSTVLWADACVKVAVALDLLTENGCICMDVLYVRMSEPQIGSGIGLPFFIAQTLVHQQMHIKDSTGHY